MVHTVALKELRPELPGVINDIDSKFHRYVVTKRGKPVVVMMSVDDFEGLMETLDILSDKDAVKRIKKAKREIKEGKTVSWDELKRKLEGV